MPNFFERQMRNATNIALDIRQQAVDTGEVADDFIGHITEPLTGNKTRRAARDAAGIQAEFGQKAIDLQKEIYGENAKTLDPYVRSGTTAFNNLVANNGAGTYEQQAFNPTHRGDFQSQNFNDNYKNPAQFNPADIANDPGYQFRLQQGADLFERRAAGQGMSARDGNFATGLMKYGQGLASEETKNAFDRFTNQRDFGYGKHLDDRNAHNFDRNFNAGEFYQNKVFDYNTQQDVYNSQAGAKTANFNNNMSLANMGLSAGNALAGVSSNMANNVASGYMGIGNSLAAGKIGQANASAAGAQNIFNLGGAFLGSKFGSSSGGIK